MPLMLNLPLKPTTQDKVDKALTPKGESKKAPVAVIKKQSTTVVKPKESSDSRARRQAAYEDYKENTWKPYNESLATASR
jgi:hypothetical protein